MDLINRKIREEVAKKRFFLLGSQFWNMEPF